LFQTRFTDRDGATWETFGADGVCCVNDPDDDDPNSWEAGQLMSLSEVRERYGPLEFAGYRPADG
jgi:hypothetical protein